MRDRYNSSVIFLATDSAKVVDEPRRPPTRHTPTPTPTPRSARHHSLSHASRTPAAKVVDECTQLAGFTCITIKVDVRDSLNSPEFIETRTDLDHAKLSIFALADWLTLRDFADMFIASSSSFSEVALHLIRARVGGHLPFVNAVREGGPGRGITHYLP